MKAFTRKELIEKLGLNNEEVKLVMKYQKTFPELLQDVNGFVIDGRNLWNQLGTPQGEFSKWVKRKIVDKGFVENQDFSKVDNFVDVGNLKRKQTDYTLTIDCAKNVCMMENTEQGRLFRNYFILMEKTVRKMVEWNKIRVPEKESYKEMCEELRLYLLRNFDKKAQFYDYSNEADALNMICLGARAKDILAYINAQDNQTREHLSIEFNTYLCKMQELNIMLLKMNMEKERRYDMIKQGFNVTYPNAVSFVIANRDNIKN